MSMLVKDHQPVVKNILGVANALKIEAKDLNVDTGENLYLSLDIEGEEKLFPFTYNEEKNDLRVLQIPLYISEDTILDGQVVQVTIQD